MIVLANQVDIGLKLIGGELFGACLSVDFAMTLKYEFKYLGIDDLYRWI